MPDQERRSVNDYTGSQSGDHTSRDAAGRDIVYQGLDPALLRYLEGERNSRDAVAATLERIWERLDGMEREARDAERDAALERGIDYDARHARQTLADQRDAATRLRLEAIDRRILWLTIGLALFALVVTALVARETGLLAARATFDALAHRR